jgi:hypothetical protein
MVKRFSVAMVVAMAAWAAPSASAVTLYGVTDVNKLVQFDSNSPGTVSEPVTITGLEAQEKVKGIDIRPATLQLYALGSTGQLYRVDVVTGEATAIGDPVVLGQGAADIDFDPRFDILRIVTESEQNMRVDPDDGTIIASDPPLSPAGEVTGAAYTNNAPASAAYPQPPGSDLFDIDTSRDQLLRQNPPEGGALNLLGGLGVNLVGDVGFDIWTESNPGTGGLGQNTAFMVGQRDDGKPVLFEVSLNSGTATPQGEVGGDNPVIDITAAHPVPLFAVLIYGGPLGADQQIAMVRADRPGEVTEPHTVSGLFLGEKLIGIDRRPADGLLYGVSDASRVFVINPVTGVATPVTAATFGAVAGDAFGVDFNPLTDRIRLVSDASENRRINPGDASQLVDPALKYSTNDPNKDEGPNVTGAAHTNPVRTASQTTLFDLDTGLDVLTVQFPPDSGTLLTVGPLGVSATDQNGFDIVSRFNQQFAALQTASFGSSSLYTVNAVAPTNGGAANGAATRIGTLSVGTGRFVQGLATIVDNALPAPPLGPGATPTPGPSPTTSPTPRPTRTPGPDPGPTGRKRPGLKAKALPKRDRKAPFRFRVTGRLQPPSGVSRSDACAGKVKIVARKGSKRLARKNANVKPTCRFAIKLRIKGSKAGTRGKLKLKIKFLGNDSLLKRTIRITARYGAKKPG